MRKKKWLLIVVGFLLLLNVIFYGLVRWAKIDQQVKNRVKRVLEKKLDAEVEIADFDFNDKQLNVTGFRIKGRKLLYSVYIPQIYIKYNLPALILSNFKDMRTIKDIKLYQPEINYQINKNSKTSNVEKDTRFQIPDLKKFFQKANIYDGMISIEYLGTDISSKVSWDSVNVEVLNSDKLNAAIFAYKNGILGIEGDIDFESNNLEKLDLKIFHMKPDYVKTSLIDDLELSADLDYHYVQNNANFSGMINKFQVTRGQYSAVADTIPFVGNNAMIDIALDSIYLDNNKLNGHLIIEDFVGKEPKINSEIISSGLELGKYFSGIKGKTDVEILVTGNLVEPRLSATAQSSEIQYAGEKLSDVQIKGDLVNDTLFFQLEKAFWLDNLIKGNGTYLFSEGLNADFYSNNLAINRYDLDLMGDLSVNVIYRNDLIVKAEYSSLSLKYKMIELDELELVTVIKNNLYEANLKRKYDDLQIVINGSLKKRQGVASVKFRQFALANILDNNKLPIISGGLSIELDPEKVIMNSQLRVFDKDYGRLSGTIVSNGAYDFIEGNKFFALKTQKVKYNYESFSVNLLVNGKKDTLKIAEFNINDEININGEIVLADEPHYNVSFDGDNLKIRDYLKYFTNYQFYRQFSGSFELELDINSDNNDLITGNCNFNNILYNGIRPLNMKNHLLGDFDKINFESRVSQMDMTNVLDLDGSILLGSDPEIMIEGSFDKFRLDRFFENPTIRGVLSTRFNLNWNKENPTFNFQINGSEIVYRNFEIDSLEIDVMQFSDRLVIDQLDAYKDNQFTFSGSGALGYNFVTGESTYDDSELELLFRGDLLNLLASSTFIIEDAASNAYLEMKIGIAEDLKIHSANFLLQQGYIKFINQQETLRKIKIDFTMENDSLNISTFSGRMGSGKINIKNLIEGDDKDFEMGGIDFGKFLITTGDESILFHMPLYMPGKSVASTRIGGRDSEYLYIYGPFDDINIVGDIYFTNGNAIYPSKSENLLNMIKLITGEKKQSTKNLPIKFDIMMHFGDNIRYVTYPFNLFVNEESYLHLEFNQEKFIASEANFTAESGTIDIFGTQMEVDFVEVNISKYNEDVKIYGKFYKKTSDGTMIYLEVSNSQLQDVSGNVAELAFNLTSNDSNDSQMDILSLLRYGRRTDEITQNQKKTLLHDEVLQLAGLGVEGVLLDPLISPLENWIRQQLKLDFFYLQTDMIQNLFNRYSSDQTEYFLDQEGQKLSQNTADVFLNNLSIGMGKYLSRKLFLNYEIQFQKLQDSSVKSDLGVYHNIIFRYDLPNNFNLAYKYSVLPFNEPNNHELRLEKTLKF